MVSGWFDSTRPAMKFPLPDDPTTIAEADMDWEWCRARASDARPMICRLGINADGTMRKRRICRQRCRWPSEPTACSS